MIRAKPHATHEVLNQVPPLIRDVADDPALLEGLRREVPPAPEGEPGALGGTAGGANAERELHELGVRAGSPETQELARLANVHSPVLRTHDRYGHRIDEVEFHPAWHRADDAPRSATACTPAPWARRRRRARTWPGRPGSTSGRRLEAGHGCPISMTYAAVPALRHEPGARGQATSRCCAARPTTPACACPDSKAGLLAGMAMTEKQGGSDVRANTTRAVPAGDGSYLLTGHKWFCSAPDVRPVPGPGPGPGGPDLLPAAPGAARRHAATRMPHPAAQGQARQPVQRLGRGRVRRGASAGWSASEGRGVATIIEMVTLTRLDCVLGSARAACGRRSRRRRTTPRTARAFGAPAGRPAADAERAGRPGARVRGGHHAGDAAGRRGRPRPRRRGEAAFLRLALPAAKYWVCKRTPARRRPRRWSAWAATATSRSRACRGCTGTRR